ncbi:MAG: hypothetical protein M3Z56_08955 [Bacteroidota bacterium]|nr:hypothetical protein [Bacteroidota bacterium]
MKKITSPKFRHSIKKSLSLIEGIFPFTEKPSYNHFEHFLGKPDGKRKDEMEACDLFSLFTADIIKEEVIFTR